MSNARDSKQRRAAAEKAKRRFTHRVADLGFARTKPTFWTRPRALWIEFVHLHLSGYAFEVHLGIRVLNESQETRHLNGPSSPQLRARGQRFRLHFDIDEASIERCVAELERFCLEVGEPWFQRFRDPRALLDSPDSPLGNDAKRALKASFEEGHYPNRVQLSKRLLGIG